MSPAGRLELIENLYSSGLLCKCGKTKVVGWDEIENEAICEIVHEENCEGKSKFIKLLNTPPPQESE